MNIKEKLIKNLTSYDKLLPRERESIKELVSKIDTDSLFNTISENNLKNITDLMLLFYLRGINDTYKAIKEEKN